MAWVKNVCPLGSALAIYRTQQALLPLALGYIVNAKAVYSMKLKYFHNPRCSKSRQGLDLLIEQGHSPEIIKYLDCPPTADELDQILRLLKLEPRELMRRKEPEYLALKLDDPALSREELIAAMVATPKLIERPILIRDDSQAALGRPAEQILEILA